jgi:hypothetical protein
MAIDIELEPGERVVFKSKRGGKAGYSPLLWIVFIFVGMQLFCSVLMLPILLTTDASISASTWVTTLLTLGAFIAPIVLWFRFTRAPAYFVTDQKMIASKGRGARGEVREIHASPPVPGVRR